MPDFKPIYRSSWSDAKENDDLDKWRESHAENIRCRDFMDEQVRLHSTEFYLDTENVIRNSVAEFGWDRTNWVLANHVQHYGNDGRFSPQNNAWAQGFYISRPADWEKKRDPHLRDHTTDYLLKSHNTETDALVRRVQKMYADLNLYNINHCETGDIHTKNFAGKLLIVRDTALNEANRTPENQLFFATHGNGCTPNAKGRSVFGHFLSDGEKAAFDRSDFLGVMDEDQMPEWAAAKLHSQQNPAPDETQGMNMKGV